MPPGIHGPRARFGQRGFRTDATVQTTMTDPFLSLLPTTALDVRHLYRALEAGTARLRLLQELGQQLSQQHDEAAVLHLALRQATGFSALERGRAVLIGGPGEALQVASSLVADPGEALPDALAERLTQPGAALWFGEANTVHLALPLHGVPGEETLLGLLLLESARPVRPPDAEDLRALELLAHQVSAALHTLRLRGQLERSERELRRVRQQQLRQRAADHAADLSPDKLYGEPLTAREGEVLALVARGLSNREIGAALSISAGTAKVHVERILDKLDVSDRTEAAVRGVALGLVET